MRFVTHEVRGQVAIYADQRRFIAPPDRSDPQAIQQFVQHLPPRPTSSPERAFLASVELLPEPAINAVGSSLGWLFWPRRYFTVLLVALSCAAAAPFVVQAGHWLPTLTVPTLDGLSRLPAYGLHALTIFLAMTALLIFHELGHAAACRRVGIRADALGVGFYLFMPAYFTRISLVKILPRRERIMVFTAGVYVQALASIGLCAAAAILDQKVLLEIATLNNLTILINLMPVMRFDGYRILSEVKADLARFDRYGMVKAAIILATTTYIGLIVFVLGNNIRRLAVALMTDSAPTPQVLVYGVLGVLGAGFFAFSTWRMLRRPRV